MRALAVGDIHFEAGPDLGREPGDRLREQELVWARALEIGEEHDCDLVLFAGDAMHKAKPSPEAMLAFERPLVQREQFGIPVIAIPGNHDVASASAGTGLEVFAEAGLLTLARTPEIHRVGDVSIACLPWASAARLVAAQDGGDRDDINVQAAEALLSVARGLRARIDGPAVLLTHFSISGAVTPDGADVGLFREPVLDAGELEAIGFDAVVAGHIHRPQFLGSGGRSPEQAGVATRSASASSGVELSCPSPSEGAVRLVRNTAASGLGDGVPEAGPLFYVGSPLPLNFGEAKTDHGVWILDVEEGRYPQTTFVPIESRPFRQANLDLATISEAGVDPLTAFDGFLEPSAWPDVQEAIVKVVLQVSEEQARRIDVAALKRAIVDAGAYKVWSVELVVQREARARVAGLSEQLGELDAFDLYLDAAGVNGSQGARLRGLTETYLQKAER